MLVAMTIAGSDSSGGAGLQADLKAFSSEGVHGTTVITAVTAQNTRQVSRIFPLSTSQIIAQIDAVLEDVNISAVKTGMLYSGDIARAVARRLNDEDMPLVVDPVMVAGVGDGLSLDDLNDAIRDELAPIATIFTPNLPEAEALLGYTISDEHDIKKACRELSALGSDAILLKGGHAEGPTCRDVLYHDERYTIMEHPRVPIRGHGGGCILAALLAANLAKGLSVHDAVIKSNDSVRHAVIHNYPIGHGVPVVNPLSRLYREAWSHESLKELLFAARKAACLIPSKMVAEGGTEFIFSLPYAKNSEDICSLEIPIIHRNDHTILPAGVMLGASQYMTQLIISISSYNTDIRSIISLKHSSELEMLVKAKGMRTVAMRDLMRAGEDNSISIELEAIDFISLHNSNSLGSEEKAMILLGQNPLEILSKLRMLIE